MAAAVVLGIVAAALPFLSSPAGATGSSATLSVFAGTGISGGPTPGTASSSEIASPANIAVDSSGNVYIADSGNNVIEKVTSSGTLSVFAGNCSGGPPLTCTAGMPADGTSPTANGLGPGLSGPTGVAVDSSGDVFIADTGNNAVEMVPATTGTHYGISMTVGDIYVVAGATCTSGSPPLCSAGGPRVGAATSSNLSSPGAVAVDSSGNLYIADSANSAVEKVTSSGTLSVFAGSCSGGPPLTCTSALPTTSTGATSSSIELPQGLAVDSSGNVYIADQACNCVEMVSATTATFYGQSMTAGDLYVVAGSALGTTGAPTANGPATSSLLTSPYAIAVDTSGNFYIADYGNHEVEKVSSAGTLTIAAGTGVLGMPAPGPATSSPMKGPDGLAMTSSGDLYISDYSTSEIYLVSTPAPPPPPAPQPSATSTQVTGVSPSISAFSQVIVAYGVALTISVDVASAAGTPSGTVSFYYSDNQAAPSAPAAFPTSATTETCADQPLASGQVTCALTINQPATQDDLSYVAVQAVFNGTPLYSASSSGLFDFVAGGLSTPTVSSISPASGPASGGTTVTVTGQNFLTTGSGTSVSFGNIPGSSVKVTSGTQLTVLSPACSGTCAPGTPVDVTVSALGQTSKATSADEFTFTPPPPTVTSVTAPTSTGFCPGTGSASGPSTGGTTVCITGSNFYTDAANDTVDFGAGNQATVDKATATVLTVSTPACAGICVPGTPVDVTVTTSSGTSATTPGDQFTYTNAGPYYAAPNGTGQACVSTSACTLTEALSIAGNSSTVYLEPGTYSGTFTLGASVTVEPDPATQTTSATYTLNAQQAGTVVTVDAGVTATIEAVTISDGLGGGNYQPPANGPCASATVAGLFGEAGGVENLGTLTLVGVTISHNEGQAANSVTCEGGPGGIQNNGTLKVTSSTISDNTGGSWDGAPHASAGVGGITNLGSSTMTSSTISGNSGGQGGSVGGISNVLGSMTITGSTISGNNGGGGWGADPQCGPCGTGGALSSGETEIQGSTISGNSGFEGGGISAVEGSTDVSDSTISGNHAVAGGGIEVGGSRQLGTQTPLGVVSIVASTISGNSAGIGSGIDNNNNISEAGSILADTCSVEANSSVTDYGYNAAPPGNGCLSGGPHDVSDSTASDFLFPAVNGGLVDWGGATKTLFPFGNAAIGAIPANTSVTVNVTPTALCPSGGATDQRGMTSPAGKSCDAGSVQTGGSVNAPSAPPGASGSASGASNASDLISASATLGGVSANATGTGGVTVATYSSNPNSSKPIFSAGGQFFDVAVSSGNSFSQLSVKECSKVSASTVVQWWDPKADGGKGAYENVTPSPTYDASTGCVTLNLSSTSSPTISELTGTVFAAGPGAAGTALPSTPTFAGGYIVATGDGQMFTFGGVGDVGSPAIDRVTTDGPVVASALTPDGVGYWLASSAGGVYGFGDAGNHGDMTSVALAAPIVGIASTPTGNGYWLVGSDGGVFTFGDAGFYGSTGSLRLDKPIVGISSTPDGKGYWLVAQDGGVFAFGDAGFFGSAVGKTGGSPVVGLAASSAGGYWVVTASGKVLAFGGAASNLGDPSTLTLAAPIASITATPDGGGYWLFGADGGVFTFGDAGYFGSAVGETGGSPAV